MRVQRAAVVLIAALACTACTTTASPGARSTRRVHAPSPAPTTAVPTVPTTTSTTTTTPVSQPATTVPSPGTRTFSVEGAVLTSGSWLSVGLHPTTAPIQLQASAGTPLEVCPAGLDGGLSDSSWPPWFRFPSCMALSSTGAATLPPTDGLTHVAFAVKPKSGAAVVPLTLTVNYTPTDSFVEVIPPAGASQTAMTVTYTPESETTGAQVTPVNSVEPAPGFTLVVSQAGRFLTQPAICDFPSELSCVGSVTPGEPITARLSGPAGPVILNLAWK